MSTKQGSQGEVVPARLAAVVGSAEQFLAPGEESGLSCVSFPHPSLPTAWLLDALGVGVVQQCVKVAWVSWGTSLGN